MPETGLEWVKHGVILIPADPSLFIPFRDAYALCARGVFAPADPYRSGASTSSAVTFNLSEDLRLLSRRFEDRAHSQPHFWRVRAQDRLNPMGLSACAPIRPLKAVVEFIDGKTLALACNPIRRAAPTLKTTAQKASFGGSGRARQRELLHVKDDAYRCGPRGRNPRRNRGRTPG